MDRLGSYGLPDRHDKELRLYVHNVDGIPDPAVEPESVKSDLLCTNVRKHHVSVLVETRTNDLDRIMINVRGTHKLVHKLNVPDGCAGRRGYGVAVIASNLCAEYMSVFRIAPDIQCVCG